MTKLYKEVLQDSLQAAVNTIPPPPHNLLIYASPHDYYHVRRQVDALEKQGYTRNFRWVYPNELIFIGKDKSMDLLPHRGTSFVPLAANWMEWTRQEKILDDYEDDTERYTMTVFGLCHIAITDTWHPTILQAKQDFAKLFNAQSRPTWRSVSDGWYADKFYDLHPHELVCNNHELTLRMNDNLDKPRPRLPSLYLTDFSHDEFVEATAAFSVIVKRTTSLADEPMVTRRIDRHRDTLGLISSSYYATDQAKQDRAPAHLIYDPVQDNFIKPFSRDVVEHHTNYLRDRRRIQGAKSLPRPSRKDCV